MQKWNARSWGKVPVRLVRGTWVATAPESRQLCLVFVDVFAGRGDSTAAAVTLDTVTDESKKNMTDGVARSPSRLCSRGGKICWYGDALTTIFLLACFCALLPTFRFSFFFLSFFIFFPASRYVYLLRVPSSVKQPSATFGEYVFF